MTKQTELVLDYVKKHRGITSAEAFYNLGIAHLPRRIKDLEESGHKIRKVLETGENRFNQPTHWIRYFISKGVQHASV